MKKRMLLLIGFLALLIVPVFSQEIPVYNTLLDLLADSKNVFLYFLILRDL